MSGLVGLYARSAIPSTRSLASLMTVALGMLLPRLEEELSPLADGVHDRQDNRQGG